jgi:hypothetical protein
MLPPQPRPLRALRSWIPVILIGLGIALAAGVGLAEPGFGAAGYVDRGGGDGGLPTGVLGARGLELQSADRSRDRGPGDLRRARQPRLRGSNGSRDAGPAVRLAAPQDAARSALARAGRLSAPSTAPPHLS